MVVDENYKVLTNAGAILIIKFMFATGVTLIIKSLFDAGATLIITQQCWGLPFKIMAMSWILFVCMINAELVKPVE